jgi:hypothetical protein
MEPEGSSPYTQEPTTCPYPEPDQSSLRPHPTSRRSILILSSHLRLGLSSGLLPSGSPPQNPAWTSPVPIRATWPAHLSLLDLITQMIFGEEYRTHSFSSCSLLHSPVSSSLSGPHILLSTLFWKTLSLHSSLNVNNKSHNHTKQQEK